MKISFKRSLEIMAIGGEVTDILVDGNSVENDEFSLLLPWAEDEAEREAERLKGCKEVTNPGIAPCLTVKHGKDGDLMATVIGILTAPAVAQKIEKEIIQG